MKEQILQHYTRKLCHDEGKPSIDTIYKYVSLKFLAHALDIYWCDLEIYYSYYSSKLLCIHYYTTIIYVLNIFDEWLEHVIIVCIYTYTLFYGLNNCIVVPFLIKFYNV